MDKKKALKKGMTVTLTEITHMTDFEDADAAFFTKMMGKIHECKPLSNFCF